MDHRTLLKLCLPRSTARGHRTNAHVLARALLRRRGGQGRVQAFRRAQRQATPVVPVALELAHVVHLEEFEHIDYDTATAPIGLAADDVWTWLIGNEGDGDDGLQAI